MALPTQVQAALDAAEATLSEANGNTQPTGDLASLLDTNQQVDPQPQSDPQPAPVPVVQPDPPQEDVWATKYRVLQGKYDAEVPALHHKVRDLETSLRDAIKRLDEASQDRQSTPQQAPTVDPKDVDNFGSDMVEMVNRVASAAIAQAAKAFDAKVTKFEEQIAQLQQKLQGTTEQIMVTAEDRFYENLAKAVPNWEEVNSNQGFLAWLRETDPVYGVPRQIALDNASKALNAERAAAVFKAYLQIGNVAPKVNESLEQQMSPKGSATAAPVPVEKPILTAAQVTKFYDDVRKGVYRGREAEAQQIEQLINSAISENRVR